MATILNDFQNQKGLSIIELSTSILREDLLNVENAILKQNDNLQASSTEFLNTLDGSFRELFGVTESIIVSV